MKAIGAGALNAKRVAALSVLALMILAPSLWIGWSLRASATLADTVRGQSGLISSLKERLAANPRGIGAQLATGGTFLPGETPAIAGAALQSLVGNLIVSEGGRVLQSQVEAVDASGEEPGSVELRVSFESNIAALQGILFMIETGAPILTVSQLAVRSLGVPDSTGARSPALQIEMTAGGYWDPAQ